MKLKTIFALLFVALFSSASFGKGATHIVYDVAVSSDNPNMQQMQSMFEGSTMEVYSNDRYYRVNMKLGSMTTTNMIFDMSTKSGITLMSSMMGKMAMKMTPEDIEKAKENKQDLSVKLVDSTKEIAGYTCKKAILTINGLNLDLWYTSAIKMGDMSGSPLDFQKIPGTPLEFSAHQGPMTMTYTASKIELNTKVDNSLFDMKIPEGYKLTSMDDLKKMGGQ